MEEKGLGGGFRQQKTLRTLTMALIFSGALNIGLVAAGIFSAFKDRQASYAVTPSFFHELKPESTNSQVMELFSKLGFRELVSYLTNRDLIEEGYAKRDLAVAALVAYHHFNLEKALGAIPEQQRKFQLSEGKTLTIFPGFNEEQYEAMIRFAYQEKWPLTGEGLFHTITHLPKPRDLSLEQAFYITPEFHTLQTLFQKTEAMQPPDVLLSLVVEGSWDLLNRFSREQEQMLDLSVDKRRRLLLSYLALQSPVAAQLLLATDFSFALKRLEDPGILALLKLLNKTPEAERFCLELFRSSRSDTVWSAAAEKLYVFAGEVVPTPLDLKVAAVRFLGSLPASPKPNVAPAPQAAPAKTGTAAAPIQKAGERFHLVKDGESLWKIARLYKVPHEEIAKLNGIDKDKLYPGMTLKIPNQGTGSEPPR